MGEMPRLLINPRAEAASIYTFIWDRYVHTEHGFFWDKAILYVHMYEDMYFVRMYVNDSLFVASIPQQAKLGANDPYISAYIWSSRTS